MPFLKKIAAPVLLVSFLAVTFFGFIAMTSEPDGGMQGGCPFPVTGTSLCPQDALAVALHHLSEYGAFVSIPLVSILEAFVGLLLLIAFAVVIRLVVHPPSSPFSLRTRFTHTPPLSERRRNITRWLSLLENSPSFS